MTDDKPIPAEELQHAHNRLNAAAGDLLAACKAMVEPFEGKPAELFTPGMAALLEMARAAIARAEGSDD